MTAENLLQRESRFRSRTTRGREGQWLDLAFPVELVDLSIGVVVRRMLDPKYCRIRRRLGLGKHRSSQGPRGARVG
jgi:hypothetical protein